MRVALCARCPHTPQDLESHYGSEAVLHLCAKCGDEQAMPAHHHPRKVKRETIMRDSPQPLRHNAANCCAVCDGKFGLVRRYSWRTALCSKKCADRFKARQEGDRRWLRRFQAA
jgi:hypothetical protein